MIVLTTPPRWKWRTMLKRILPWLIKGGISVALIVWVLARADLSMVGQQISQLGWRPVVVALLLLQIQTVVGAVRWGFVLRALSASLSWGRTCAVYFISVFFAIVLPGAVGGDAVRMWFSRKVGLSVSSSVNSVLLERAMTVFALIMLVCLTQPILAARVPNLPASWLFPVLLAVSILGILTLASLDRLPQRWMVWKPLAAIIRVAADTRRLFFHPGWSLLTLLIALFGHINLALSVYVLADGMGIPLHVLDCLVLVPPVILVMTLPISISGWGVRETAMVTAFSYVGVESGQALALSILFGLVTMVGTFPGGVIFLLMRQQSQTPESGSADDSADISSNSR